MKGKCDMLMPKRMMEKVNGDMGMKYRGKKGKKKGKMDEMNGKPGMAVVIAVGKVKKAPGKKKK